MCQWKVLEVPGASLLLLHSQWACQLLTAPLVRPRHTADLHPQRHPNSLCMSTHPPTLGFLHAPGGGGGVSCSPRNCGLALAWTTPYFSNAVWTTAVRKSPTPPKSSYLHFPSGPAYPLQQFWHLYNYSLNHSLIILSTSSKLLCFQSPHWIQNTKKKEDLKNQVKILRTEKYREPGLILRLRLNSNDCLKKKHLDYS